MWPRFLRLGLFWVIALGGSAWIASSLPDLRVVFIPLVALVVLTHLARRALPSTEWLEPSILVRLVSVLENWLERDRSQTISRPEPPEPPKEPATGPTPEEEAVTAIGEGSILRVI